MKNFILQNENAVYFECKFSCDNVIFLNLENEKYFITDARYVIEAKEYAKNCEVIESSDLVNTTKEILKKSNIKKIIFDPNDFTYATYIKLSEDLKVEFIPKPNFSKEKRAIKTQKEIKLLKKAAEIGRDITKVYFNPESADELLQGYASSLGTAGAGD
mgnify:CR=1 FL=1